MKDPSHLYFFLLVEDPCSSFFSHLLHPWKRNLPLFSVISLTGPFHISFFDCSIHLLHILSYEGSFSSLLFSLVLRIHVLSFDKVYNSVWFSLFLFIAAKTLFFCDCFLFLFLFFLLCIVWSIDWLIGQSGSCENLCLINLISLLFFFSLQYLSCLCWSSHPLIPLTNVFNPSTSLFQWLSSLLSVWTTMNLW